MNTSTKRSSVPIITSIIKNVIKRRVDIQTATELLRATEYANGTLWGWLDPIDGTTVCLSSEDAMSDLGARLRCLANDATREDRLELYPEWCQVWEIDTSDARAFVSSVPELRGHVFDADGMREAAGAAGDYLTCAVIDHAHDQIEAML